MREEIRVLLVEDNPGDADLIREILTQAETVSFRVEHAERLSEALDRMNRERVDLVLLDLGLPDSQGLETLRAVLAGAPESPVVVLTGTADEALALESVKSGAQEYLSKNVITARALERVAKYSVERHRAAATLRDALALQTALMEAMPSPVFIKDTAGVYLGGNEAFGRFLGLAREQFVGKTVHEIAPPDLAEIYTKADRELLERKGIQSYKTNVLDAEGTRRDVIMKKALFTDSKGETAGIVGVIHDITDLRRSEAALAEKDRQMQAVLESISLLGVVLNPRGHIIFCNDFLLNVTGWRREEVMDRSWFELFIPPDGLPSLQEGVSFRTVFTEELPLHYQNEIVTRTGERRLVGWTNVLLRDPAGEIAGVASIGEDITERCLAEDMLRESEERYRTILEAMDEGYYEVDLEGTFLFWNPAMCRMLGRSREDLLGLNNRAYMSADTAKAVFQAFNRVFRTGVPERALDWELIRKDGLTIWVETSISLNRTVAGEVIGFKGVIRNVSDRRGWETALKESEERFRNIYENTSLAFYQSTPEGRVLMANPAMVRMLGLDSQEELQNCDLHALALRQGYPREAFIEQMEREGRVQGLETIWWRQDGRLIARRETARAVRDDLGQILYYEGFVEDISDRHLAEEALRHSERNLNETQALAKIGGWTLDLAGEFAWSEEIYRIFGVSPQSGSLDIVSFFRLIHPGDRPAMSAWLEACTEERAPGELVYRITLPDGSVRHISSRGKLIRDSEGNRLHMSGTVQDISERVHAEEALKESEEKYRLLADFTFDWETWVGPDQRFRYVSGGCERISGYTQSDFLNDPDLILRIVHPEDSATVACHYRDDFKDVLPCVNLDFRIRTKLGEERWISHTCRPVFGEHGVFLGRRGTNRDITERRLAEAALSESEARYRDLVESSGDLIGLHDLSGVVLACNPTAVEFYGAASTEDLIGKSTRDFLPPPFRNAFDAYLDLLQREGRAQGHMRVATLRGEERILAYDNSLKTVEGGPPVVRTHGRDVTAEVRATKALRESEERFRMLFEQNQAGVFSSSREGAILECNQAFARMLGYDSPEEVMRQRAQDLYFSQTDRASFLTLLGEHGTTADLEECLRRKDGTELWVLSSTSQVVQPGGEWLIQGTLVDITKRRLAEEGLKQSEQVFRSFFETNLAASYLATTDGHILTCNTAFLDLFGFGSAEEAAAHSLFKLFANQEARRTFEAELADQGSVRLHETGRRSLHGRFLTVLESATALRDDGGNITGLLGFMLDITERRRVDRDRRLLAAALEQANDAVVVLDDKELVLYLNPAFEVLSGFDRTELKNRSISQVITSLDRTVLDAVRQAVLEGRPWTGRMTIRQKGGGSVCLDAAFTALPRQGQSPLALGIIRDITSELDVQERLARARRIEGFGRVASGVAHEVRNPLFAISTVVAALERKVSGDPQLQPFMDHIQDHVHRLSALMDDLLALGRPIDPSSFVSNDLSAVLKSAVEDLEAAVPGSLQRFQLELSQFPCRIQGDAIRLSQAMMNILSNALHFSPAEIPVQVTLRPVAEGFDLAVSNGGPTIPEELLQTIFDPFVTTRKGGTGLGLAIVRQIVAAHGGTATAENHPDGGGVTFTLTFPAGD